MWILCNFQVSWNIILLSLFSANHLKMQNHLGGGPHVARGPQFADLWASLWQFICMSSSWTVKRHTLRGRALISKESVPTLERRGPTETTYFWARPDQKTMSGTGWLTVNLRRSNEGKRLCFWKWRVFFEVWVKVFGSHFREAHYVSAFSLQDKRKISNTQLPSRGRTCGPKRQTNRSPFKAHCRMTQLLTVRKPRKHLFHEKRAPSTILTGLAIECVPREMRGNRGYFQGLFCPSHFLF